MHATDNFKITEQAVASTDQQTLRKIAKSTEKRVKACLQERGRYFSASVVIAHFNLLMTLLITFLVSLKNKNKDKNVLQ